MVRLFAITFLGESHAARCIMTGGWSAWGLCESTTSSFSKGLQGCHQKRSLDMRMAGAAGEENYAGMRCDDLTQSRPCSGPPCEQLGKEQQGARGGDTSCAWRPWTTCSAPCGPGVQQRECTAFGRQCLAAGRGLRCMLAQSRSCLLAECARRPPVTPGMQRPQRPRATARAAVRGSAGARGAQSQPPVIRSTRRPRMVFVLSAPTALELFLAVNGLVLLWCGVRAFTAKRRGAGHSHNAPTYSALAQQCGETDASRAEIEMK
jgi:hypothetical protein